MSSTSDISPLGSCEKMRKPGLKGALEHLYFTYSVNFGLYMLEPWEVRMFNAILCCMFMMSLYTFCVYFPPYVIEMLIYIGLVSSDVVKVEDFS